MYIVIFSKMSDVVNLRGEVKQLTVAAQNLEPYVSQLSTGVDSEEIAKLKSLLNEISQLKDPQRFVHTEYRVLRTRSRLLQSKKYSF